MRAKKISWDERRNLMIPGNEAETLDYCVGHWIDCAQAAITDHGYFAVALSGGNTPRAIFQKLTRQHDRLDWSKVLLFWSDERAVSPDNPDSNFYMAMEAGFKQLLIPAENIHRMQAETSIEAHAQAYESLIRRKIPSLAFDLIMLGMGDDGHTASLFPHTQGLHETHKLVIANEIPQKQCWRMTFTFPLINQAQQTCFYVLGANKQEMIKTVLMGPYLPEEHPCQRIGTPHHKALWILDEGAAKHTGTV